MTEETIIIEVINPEPTEEEKLELRLHPFKVIAEPDKLTFEEKVNELILLGYELKQPVEVHPELNARYWAVLVLKAGKYDDITNVKDVPTEDVDAYLAEGWKIINEYSKYMRLAKRGTPSL